MNIVHNHFKASVWICNIETISVFVISYFILWNMLLQSIIIESAT